jgi:hypothetical protein
MMIMTTLALRRWHHDAGTTTLAPRRRHHDAGTTTLEG